MDAPPVLFLLPTSNQHLFELWSCLLVHWDLFFRGVPPVVPVFKREGEERERERERVREEKGVCEGKDVKLN